MDDKTLDFLQKLFFDMMSVDLLCMSKPFAEIETLDRRFRSGMKNSAKQYQSFRELLERIGYGCFYLVTDSYRMHYILFFPEPDCRNLISVGPYMDMITNDQYFSDITNSNTLSYSTLEHLKEFLYNLPLLDDNLMLISALSTILDYIAPASPAFQLEYLTLDAPDDEDPLMLHDDFDELVENTERRYAAEAELLDCITRGDAGEVTRKLNHFLSHSFPPRIKDILRERKNLLITANTMFRKAAQLGSVHPYHLHRLSSYYAKVVEQCTTIQQIDRVSEKMARDYCLLVKNKSVKNYSPVIQQAINYIEIHISSPLSLSHIAKRLNISPPYLSGLFKKELGVPLTTFVSQQRISRALKLLASTDMQIQNIALHVGIEDVNYFTKIFKKQIGVTPRDYRSELR